MIICKIARDHKVDIKVPYTLVRASEELVRTMGCSQCANGSQVWKMRSGIARMLRQRSLGKTTSIPGDDPEAQLTNGA